MRNAAFGLPISELLCHNFDPWPFALRDIRFPSCPFEARSLSVFQVPVRGYPLQSPTAGCARFPSHASRGIEDEDIPHKVQRGSGHRTARG